MNLFSCFKGLRNWIERKIWRRVSGGGELKGSLWFHMTLGGALWACPGSKRGQESHQTERHLAPSHCLASSRRNSKIGSVGSTRFELPSGQQGSGIDDLRKVFTEWPLKSGRIIFFVRNYSPWGPLRSLRRTWSSLSTSASTFIGKDSSDWILTWGAPASNLNFYVSSNA